MAARAPTHFGRYELVGPLASGGMADLHLARASGPSGFESLAVVKRIRPHLAANPEFVRLFLSEARLAAGLRHPNVVSVYDAGQEGDEYYFVMEFVHGRDLRALIAAAKARARPISIDEAVTIAVGICAGLHHAHQATDGERRPLGIVHRDISPSNVLVSFDGGVKLADFGIAKPTRHANEPGTNTLRGKLSYMSPEQLLGMNLDRRSDLYSLAVVLYELTTGARPFGRAASEFLEIKQSLEVVPQAPSSRRADFPPELEDIIMRGLDRRRERRQATARDLQLELEAFARRQQLALSPLTLGHMMEELFSADLDAWQLAQRRGTSLAQHVTDTHSLDPRLAEDAATSPVPAGAAEPEAHASLADGTPSTPPPSSARAAASLAPSHSAATDLQATTTPRVSAASDALLAPLTVPAPEPRWRGAIVTASAMVVVALVALLTATLQTRASRHAKAMAATANAAANTLANGATPVPANAATNPLANGATPLHSATNMLANGATPATADGATNALANGATPATATGEAPGRLIAAAGVRNPPRARPRPHAPKHVAKRARASSWDPETAVLPH